MDYWFINRSKLGSLILTTGKWRILSMQMGIGMKSHYLMTFQDSKLRKFLIFHCIQDVEEITDTGNGAKMGNTRLRQGTFSK